MSAEGEQEVLMREIEQEERKERAPMCVLSKSGITLFGFHVSWIVLVLVAVLIVFWLNKDGTLMNSVSNILGTNDSTSRTTAPVTTPSITRTTTTVRPNRPVLTGGSLSPFPGNPGQVRQMMDDF
jgi:hypothetical protein